MLRPTTDGVVVIRPPRPGDAQVLIAGRDEEFRRWLGEGAAEPEPTGCILVDGHVAGWVDHDLDHAWLEPGEVNVGYHLFAEHRGRGMASRAVQLLMHHLAVGTEHRTAALLVDVENERSLALAGRLGFSTAQDIGRNRLLKRAVPPLAYSDGTVTIRRQEVEDLDADLDAKDEEQIRWLWLPGHRESWEAMTPDEQRDHALRGLQANRDAFGSGPKWTFAVDVTGGPTYVAYVDCDLANERVPRGEANVSFSAHPAHRGRGYVRRAVRLVTQFLRDHTAVRQAHLIADAENAASIGVATAVGAAERERWSAEGGHTLVRHVLDV